MAQLFQEFFLSLDDYCSSSIIWETIFNFKNSESYGLFENNFLNLLDPTKKFF